MKPLPRPRILVTRSPHQASELAERLRACGAEPVLIPTIEIAEPTSFAGLDTAVAQLGRYHWLLFTSANAVEAFAQRFTQNRGPAATGARLPELRDASIVAPVSEASRIHQQIQIAAIGPATAQAVLKLGLVASAEDVLLPPQAVAESLTAALLPHVRQPDGAPTRFLLVRAEEARELLPETLRSAGAEVTIAAAYRTIVPERSIAAVREVFKEPASVDAISFTSSSSARNLVALCEAAAVTLSPHPLRISIGPITSQTLKELGLPPHAEAPRANVESLAATTMETLSSAGVTDAGSRVGTWPAAS